MDAHCEDALASGGVLTLEPAWEKADRKTISHIRIAMINAENTHCVHYKVGCVVVEPKKNRVISSGYNGPIRGALHCDKYGCNKDKGRFCLGTHAEMNAILNVLGSPLDNFEGAIVYTTYSPCTNCMKHLVQAGIAKIVFVNGYVRRPKQDETTPSPDDSEMKASLEIAKMMKIVIEQYDPKTKKIRRLV